MGKYQWAGLPRRLAACPRSRKPVPRYAPAAGASPGGPLHLADVSLTLPRRGRDVATLNFVKRFLPAQQAPFRPVDVTTVRLASAQAVPHTRIHRAEALPGLLGTPTEIRRPS